LTDCGDPTCVLSDGGRTAVPSVDLAAIQRRCDAAVAVASALPVAGPAEVPAVPVGSPAGAGDTARVMLAVAGDVAVLVGEVRRLRLRLANLTAAARAALTAVQDRDTDPWAYLRDELPPAPPGHPLHAIGRDHGRERTGPDTTTEQPRGTRDMNRGWC